MNMGSFDVRFPLRGVGLGIAVWLLGAARVLAQPAPSQEPFAGPTPTPPSAVPPMAAALPAAATREAQLEQRILQLEAMVSQLQYQVGQGRNGSVPYQPGTVGGPTEG